MVSNVLLRRTIMVVGSTHRKHVGSAECVGLVFQEVRMIKSGCVQASKWRAKAFTEAKRAAPSLY